MKTEKVKLHHNAISMLLKTGIVEVEFIKKNGEYRKMKCTTKLDYIPKDKHPTGEGNALINEKVMRVYDINAEGWRSFNVDSIQNFSIGRI